MSDLLYGIHPVYEALVAGRREFKALYVSKRRKRTGVQALLKQARAEGIPIEFKTPEYFKSHLGDSVHQGIAAHVGDLPLVDESAILKKAESENAFPLVLALDGIVDPQNLGSLVRTALAMGVHGIVLPKNRSAPLSCAVSKASAGAMEHVLFARVTNLVAALKQFQKRGLWVIGSQPGAEQRLDEVDFNMGLVLVVGGEGKGMRHLVQEACDYVVSVPQEAVADSLNAAVAGAIVMYEIMKQRKRIIGYQ